MSDTPPPPTPSNPPSPPSPPAAAPAPLPPELLQKALHAFKKRIKLTRLDQESSLGAGRPMTSGKKSDIMGIIPPNQFPREVWKELARQGKIKDMGGGFYSPV